MIIDVLSISEKKATLNVRLCVCVCLRSTLSVCELSHLKENVLHNGSGGVCRARILLGKIPKLE